MSYTTEPEAWGPLPWALLSRACREQGHREWAVNCARRALALAPEDGPLQAELAEILAAVP